MATVCRDVLLVTPKSQSSRDDEEKQIFCATNPPKIGEPMTFKSSVIIARFGDVIGNTFELTWMIES